MKGMFKKALAGVAATALAVTGLALGTATANAAPYAEDATITLTGETAANTTYTAYKIGSYVEDDSVVTGGALTAVGIDTETAWEDVAAETLGSDVTSSQEYKAYGDPLAYVAGTSVYGTENSSQLVAFVDDLAGAIPAGVNPAGSFAVTEDGQPVAFTGLAEGLYLVVSTINGTDPVQLAGKAVAIIGTKVTVDGVEYTKLNEMELGKAEVKPSTPQKPVKEGEVVDGGDVYPGKQIEYTIHGTVPQYVGDKFAFIDTPGLGLTVTVDTDNIKVYTGTTEQLETPIEVTDFELSVSNDNGASFVPATAENKTIKGAANGANQFKVSLNDPEKYAGKTIWVVYKTVVNNEAVDTVNNTVKFDDPATQTDSDNEMKVKKNTITFQKVGVDADADGLDGVTFTLTADSTENNVGLPEGYVVDAASKTVDGKKGVVTFANLPNGKYTITEKTPDDGYMNTKTSFTVTVKDGVITEFDDDTLGLAVKDENGDITVKNVKLITQLPLTGAAGTALFTVLGLLIAGAGALVYMKSRSVKHMLRG